MLIEPPILTAEDPQITQDLRLSADVTRTCYPSLYVAHVVHGPSVWTTSMLGRNTTVYRFDQDFFVRVYSPPRLASAKQAKIQLKFPFFFRLRALRFRSFLTLVTISFRAFSISLYVASDLFHFLPLTSVDQPSTSQLCTSVPMAQSGQSKFIRA